MRRRAGDCGFTLIEMLMALTVFALIAAIAYGAMASAGQGFQILAKVRDRQEGNAWIARQLRQDMAYLAQSSFQVHGASVPPIRMLNDNRGADEFDELRLLVQEPGRPGISEVSYAIDEQQGHLIRRSRLLWAGNTVESVEWDMGEASSWAVEALDQDGRWHQDWKQQPGAAYVWPKALRVRMKARTETGEYAREWLLPVLFGVEL